MRAEVLSEHRRWADAMTEANHVAVGRHRRGSKGRVRVRSWHLRPGAPTIYQVLVPARRGRR